MARSLRCADIIDELLPLNGTIDLIVASYLLQVLCLIASSPRFALAPFVTRSVYAAYNTTDLMHSVYL